MRPRLLLPLLLVVAGLALDVAAQEAPVDGQPPRLRLMGFGDFNYESGDTVDDEHESEFSEGQFVLHVVSQLSPSFSFFAELSLTARDDEFRAEVERTFVKYSYNDNLKLMAGRFHTPISWWNAAYHHGSWLQAAIARPQMIAFGSEFIPIHFVGVIAEGAIPSGGANLNYMAGVGNGRSENTARGGDAGDANNHRATFARIYARPNRPYGLEAGAAYYLDRVTTGLTEEFDEEIASAYIVNDRDTPQVVAEVFRIEREGRESGQKFTSDAYYLQVGYRLPQLRGRLMPYARYEESDLAEGEPVFDRFRSNDGEVVGLRFDASAFVSLKAEYSRRQFESGPHVDGVVLQINYTF